MEIQKKILLIALPNEDAYSAVRNLISLKLKQHNQPFILDILAVNVKNSGQIIPAIRQIVNALHSDNGQFRDVCGNGIEYLEQIIKVANAGKVKTPPEDLVKIVAEQTFIYRLNRYWCVYLPEL
mgnify:CR=1 FL=1